MRMNNARGKNTLPGKTKSRPKLAARHLTDAISSFSFLKQPCQKTHLVGVEKMFVFLRRVKQLACMKKRKHLKRLQKLLNLGELCIIKKNKRNNKWGTIAYDEEMWSERNLE